MNSKIISLKIRDGEPLFVVKTRLIAESRMFRYLIDELNYDELEMDDFSPEAVNLFITILLEEFQRTILIKHDLFRDTHKLAVVFEVDWIKSDCQNLLREEMKSIKSYEDTFFLFEECYYIYSKWKERNLIDTLISSLVIRENSLFISRYMSDLRKITTGQINILLTIGGSNTDTFLKILLKNIEKSKILSGKVKHLLKKMNLAFACEQNAELYLTLFDTISELPDVSVSDLQFTHKIRSETARMVSSRKGEQGTIYRTETDDKMNKNQCEINVNVVSDEKTYQKLLSGCEALSDIVKLISDNCITSMYTVVQMILDLYCIVEVDKHLGKFLKNLENKCSDKKLNRISRQYLDIVISALKYSTLKYTDDILALMKAIRSSRKLSSFHENIIIKPGMVVTEKNGFNKEVFTFSHPANANGRCEMVGRCGFVLKVPMYDEKVLVDELLTDPKDYEGTSRHYHDVIKAQDMFRYTVMTGVTKDGVKIRTVGRWTEWWKRYFSRSIDWEIEEEFVAYNVADYRVSKLNYF